jgi:spore maturation protein CgeB
MCKELIKSSNIKIILAGNWKWPMYQKACSDALKDLGVNVIPFKFSPYFSGIIGRFESHTLIDISRSGRMNKDLIRLCNDVQPDVLFVWSCMHLKNKTLEVIRNMGVLLISYNNDDPFAKRYHELRYIHLRGIWRNFVGNLPYYHLNYVYRKKNIIDYKNRGVKQVDILPSYYIPLNNFPLHYERGVEFDGVFIGHYEKDERYSCIKALQDNGVKVKVYGTGWNKCKEDINSLLSKTSPVLDSNYNEALNRAHFALCFFSKLNNDEYTRRVFEIPATKTLLVAQRTKTMSELYIDGEEAIFFDDEVELVSRITALLSHPDKIKSIAEKGYQRCVSSGYDVNSRMVNLLSQIQSSLIKK